MTWNGLYIYIRYDKIENTNERKSEGTSRYVGLKYSVETNSIQQFGV